MSQSSKQAAEALREIEAVGHRSGQLYRYQQSAPMLILWGAIWMVGFGITDLLPAKANFIWIPLDIIGVLGCIYFGRQGKVNQPALETYQWLASIASIFAFSIVVLVIFQPTTGKQAAALISLIVALFYVLGGIWMGARFAVAGIAVAVLTLFGYLALAAHFYLWMAVVGGGALMLAGLWLRKA